MSDFLDDLLAETGISLNTIDRITAPPTPSVPLANDSALAVANESQEPTSEQQPSSFFSDEEIDALLSTFDTEESNEINDVEFEEENNEEEERVNEQEEALISRISNVAYPLNLVYNFVNEENELYYFDFYSRSSSMPIRVGFSLNSSEDDIRESLTHVVASLEEPSSTSTEAANTETPQVAIPQNSPSLLINETTSRFSGAEWYTEIQKQRVILAGLGGIGSYCALMLARMIPAAIFLYDDDIVEAANMSGQLYSSNDIGKYKVNAMSNMIAGYTSARSIVAINEKFTSLTEAGDIMICGFDSMEARDTFFHAWLAHVTELTDERKKQCVFIDGRLSIDTLQVYCIAGDDSYNIDKYEKTALFSDSEADETICSLKQTSYLANMIGSVMVNLFTNFVANQLNPIIPYDLPFFTEYDSHSMIFKTER